MKNYIRRYQSPPALRFYYIKDYDLRNINEWWSLSYSGVISLIEYFKKRRL